MPDWNALERAKWRIVRELEAGLEKSAAQLAAEVVRRLKAAGWALDEDTAAAIEREVATLESGLRQAIEAAVAGVAAQAVPEAMRPGFVSEQVRDAFERRWDDGAPLSRRLWRLRGEMLEGMRRTLAEGIALGRASGNLVYDLQRAIEAEGGRFAVPAELPADFVNTLADAGRRLIRDPKAHRQWRRTLDSVRNHLARLKEGGTRRQAEAAVTAVQKAVNAGREDLLESAVRWWVYDRHLYNLRRIARTEIATAHHRAAIAATRDDDLVIGYRWRLSASHPDPDICDWFAGIELGLGKGVWPKDRVPEEKAHPHCMCQLIPTTRKNREKGHKSPGELLDALSDREKARIAPRWARDLKGLGIDWDATIDPKTGWFARKKDLVAKVGKDRFDAMQALGKAMGEPAWPRNRIRLGGRLWRRTAAELERYRRHREVDEFLRRVESNGGREVDSRRLHYLKRKYVNGWDLRGPEDLDARFAEVLAAADAEVFQEAPGKRYHIHSAKLKRTVVVHPDGRRITVMDGDRDRLIRDLGEPKWHIPTLTATTFT